RLVIGFDECGRNDGMREWKTIEPFKEIRPPHKSQIASNTGDHYDFIGIDVHQFGFKLQLNNYLEQVYAIV
ncbi:hypothetical protein SNEBB_007893, partial [Seison nebaliae]